MSERNGSSFPGTGTAEIPVVRPAPTTSTQESGAVQATPERDAPNIAAEHPHGDLVPGMQAPGMQPTAPVTTGISAVPVPENELPLRSFMSDHLCAHARCRRAAVPGGRPGGPHTESDAAPVGAAPQQVARSDCSAAASGGVTASVYVLFTVMTTVAYEQP